MRISGGRVRGHRIEVPIVSDLRPSQDKVREAVFNILGDINKTLVLDIYAGTGALGIEALSRGARFCDFIDKSKDVCTIIERNLRNADFAEFGDVYCEMAETFVLRPVHQKYDLIFMDPPYADFPRSVIRMLPKFLSDHGQLIYLHAKRITLTEGPDREYIKEHLEVIDTRRYGATHVSFMVKKDSGQSSEPS